MSNQQIGREIADALNAGVDPTGNTQKKEPEAKPFIPYPKDWPPNHNACSDPCDMLYGPCACGAWHHLSYWEHAHTEEQYKHLEEQVNQLTTKNKKLLNWVRDLQDQGWVTCVYCGHRYGPRDKTPTALADALKEHVEQCPEHPMAKLKKENERLKTELETFLKNYNGDRY